MNKPSHPISRRKLLRGLVGFAGVGVVGTSVGGYVWSKHSSSALVQSAVTATASNQYRTLANFRPPPIAIAVAASGTAAGVVLTDCHKGTGHGARLLERGEPQCISAPRAAVAPSPLGHDSCVKMRCLLDHRRAPRRVGRPPLTRRDRARSQARSFAVDQASISFGSQA